MGPKSGNNDGWVPSETEVVMQDVKTVLGQYTIDRTRVVAHGMGNGGQMAFYVGFNARDMFRGVGDRRRGARNQPEGERREPAAVVLHRRRRQGSAHQGHRREQGPARRRSGSRSIYREMKESGKEYFDAADVRRVPRVAGFARPDLTLSRSNASRSRTR